MTNNPCDKCTIHDNKCVLCGTEFEPCTGFEPCVKAHETVFLEDGGWYFWNETWVDKYGPYETEEEARSKLQEYCDTYLR